MTPIQSIQCIIPPHMLREITERGSPAQREWALRTVTLSVQIRALRRAAAEFPSLVQVQRAVAQQKQRTVYSADGDSTLPGRKVRGEGDPPSSDPAVNEAYDGAGATYDMYSEVYKRNSIDDNGLKLDSTVHYQKSYDNAFWDGQQMVYGDGDEDLPEAERLFNRFTIAPDIIGHELTHGVTQFEAELVYWDQPGALNESMSDVFGALVKQRMLNQTAEIADWIIGAGLFTSNVHGVGIRSMKAPGTAYDDPVMGRDPQPAHMRDYKTVEYDNGGVHINSGIPNYAFYVTARELGGFAWEKAGRIWYVTLRDKLQTRASFQDCANATIVTAGELYGEGSLEQQTVRKGWAEVGLAAEAAGCASFIMNFARSGMRQEGKTP